MDARAAVQRQFAPVAANYTTSAVHAAGPDLAAMLAATRLRGSMRVLDVGCGTGHTALAFAPSVGEVIAVDLTPAMLDEGRRLAAERGIVNVRFQQGDVERLPVTEATVDLVTSRYSAHHYPHPAEAIREIGRVLRPDGVFLLVDVVAPGFPLGDTFLNAIELLRDPSHVRDHAIGQWLSMLASGGFTAEVIETWPLRLEFDSWVARMRTPPAAVTQIRALLDDAPREVRAALAVEDGHTFSVPVALIRAHHQPARVAAAAAAINST